MAYEDVREALNEQYVENARLKRELNAALLTFSTLAQEFVKWEKVACIPHSVLIETKRKMFDDLASSFVEISKGVKDKRIYQLVANTIEAFEGLEGFNPARFVRLVLLND